MAGAYAPLSFTGLTSSDFAGTAAWVTTNASRVNDAAQSFLEALADLNAIDFSQVGDLPTFNSPVLFGSIAGIGDRPVRPTIQVANFDALLQRLGQLSPPDAPTAGFTYTDPGYASILRDPLLQKLLLDLTAGGYGIEPGDEAALWDRMRDREARAYQAAVEEAKRQAAASSFPLPQGSLQATLDKAQQEYASKVSSANRDIALRRSELYVQARQFTIEKVLASEEQSIVLYNAIQNRALQAAQVEVQMAIALFDGGIRAFAAQVEAITKQIDVPLAANQQLVSLYSADVSAYAAYVNAVASAAEIDIRNSRNLLDSNITQHQSRVEKVRFQLQQLATTVELRKAINQYGTEFFRTALGAAVNGINGLAVQSGTV